MPHSRKQMRHLFFISIAIVIFSLQSLADLQIPKNLDKQDRKAITEILGLSSSMKLLGDPYPLGGYSGVEIGLSSEVIATEELSRLGDKAQASNETNYSLLTLGKGLYNNLDVYVQFTPFPQNENVSNFGGMVRWGFYQAEYLPAHLSLIAYANSMSYQNLINCTSLGYDLVIGFSVEDVTLYTGFGLVRSQASFVGGAGGVTDTGLTEQEESQQMHYLAGLSLKFSKVFLAAQLDRYTEATYSAKLGVRF